jgi:hypothetical protein
MGVARIPIEVVVAVTLRFTTAMAQKPSTLPTMPL